MHFRPFLTVAALSLVLVAVAQDKGRGRRSQDKKIRARTLKLNSKFEAWYTITRTDKHVGSAQINIDPYRSGEIKETQYKQDLIFDMVDSEGGVPAYRLEKHVDAKLSADFDIKTFQYRFLFLNRHYKAELSPDGSQITLEVVGEDKKETFSMGDLKNPYLHPELALLILAQKGELLKSPLHEMSVINHKSGSLELVPVTLKVVGEETRRYMNQLVKVIRVGVDKAPESYNVSDFWVDSYGRIMEYQTKSKVRIQIARDAQFTRIAKRVETWYVGAMTIEQEEKQVGHYHAVYDPQEVSISYQAETERKYAILDSVEREFIAITAQLSPRDYSMRKGTFTWTLSHLSREVRFDGRDRQLTVKDHTGREDTFVVDREKKFFFTIDQALVALAQTEQLLKAGIHDVHILDPGSLELVRLQIAVRGIARRSYLGREFLALQVQARSSTEQSWDIYVDKYGRPLEISMDNGPRFIVVSGEKDAREQLRAPLPPQDTLDPIESKLTLKTPDDRLVGFEDRRRDLEASYIDVRKTYETIQQMVDAGDRTAKKLVPKFRAGIDLFRKSLINLQEFKEEVERDPQIRVWSDQVGQWERAVETFFPVEEALRETLQSLERDFVKRVTANDLPGARKVMSQIRALEVRLDEFGQHKDWARERITTIESRLKDIEAEKTMDEIMFDISAIAWERKTEIHPIPIRLDLFGVGLIRVEPVRLLLVRAYAVIDGAIYTEGETITKEEIDLTVDRIDRDKVTFRFRHLTKSILMRK